jgi:5-methylcytosine-specific restriction enzyme subunit McrC
VFVGDVKYKRITPAGFPNADIYQMLAYVTAADLPGGLLVYAAGEQQPVLHTIRHLGKTVEVVALDLTQSPEGILAQIEVLAKRVRQLRDSDGMRRPASPGYR